MKFQLRPILLLPLLASLTCASSGAEEKSVGVGAKPIPRAEVILDGSRQMLDALWTIRRSTRSGAGRIPELTAATTAGTASPNPPAGLKLQAEGHGVRFRNAWVLDPRL